MEQIITSMFCNTCNQKTLHQKNIKETNHTIHVTLSIVTFSIYFVLIYIPLILNRYSKYGMFQCKQCNSNYDKGIPTITIFYIIMSIIAIIAEIIAEIGNYNF